MPNAYDDVPLPPGVVREPGMAASIFAELAPLLVEDGIDLKRAETWAADIPSLEAALGRAVARRNMLLFSPVGRPRELALDAIRGFLDGLLSQDAVAATAAVLQFVPESPDGSQATVAAGIGVSLGLLDEWLTGRDPDAPRGLADRPHHVPHTPTRPAAERATNDILALASKGRAFDAIAALIAHHGGDNVLLGGVGAVAATIKAWAIATNAPISEVASRALH